MATSVTFKYNVHGHYNKGVGGELSGSVSLNDVVVNTTVNSSGGFNTATVTADKQRDIFLGATDAATAGVPSGWYAADGGGVFRRKPA